LTSEDAALFREAIGAVRPMQARQPAAGARPAPPQPEARQRAADEREALRISREDPFALGPGAELSWRRDEVPAKVLRRLRRGEYSVQDEIDLHHLQAEPAAVLLRAFLSDARRRHHLCVRIVHGKGLGSGDNGPVLKRLTDRMLRQRSEVLAFASAPAAQGGTGAVLVLLAPRREAAARG